MKNGRENIIVAYLAMIMPLAIADNDGNHHGWDYAHATFYGDMSGGETMSKCVHVRARTRKYMMFSSPLYFTKTECNGFKPYFTTII